MPSKAEAKVTTDHDEIQSWAEERGGQPACVKGTGNPGDVGLLRIDFPGFAGEETLQHITWDEWFGKFEEQNLALLHQEETAGGAQSNFNKLIKRDPDTGPESKGRGRRAPAKKGAAKPAGKKTVSKAAKPVTVKKAAPGKKSVAVSKKSAAKKAVAKKAASKAVGSSGRTAGVSRKNAPAPRKGVEAKNVSRSRNR